ncbi:MAG TPA: cupin domain-containing protein [Chloroflexota bacterium]|nr:cupin domain-containing protein [Chloroflexota bacterium]
MQAPPSGATALAAELAAHVARYTSKVWDWDAFPASRGFPELERAQMRYVGSGGSPKTDPTTFPPEHFTCSLIYQERDRYAAVHAHQVEELFLVHTGQLTVTFDYDDATVDLVLGPRDCVLNPPGRAHGFRNDGPGPVVSQTMVAIADRSPLPTYKSHPSNHAGAQPPAPPPIADPGDPRVQDALRHVVRASQVRPQWEPLPSGSQLARLPYVMPRALGGVVEPLHFSLELLHLPVGAATPNYRHEYETAFMVFEGVLDVAWTDGGDEAAEARLGPRDLVLVPAGQRHALRNSDLGPALAAAILGTPAPAAGLWRAGDS